MIALFDIGNTRAKFVLLKENEHIQSHTAITSIYTKELTTNYLEQTFVKANKVTTLIIISVTNEMVTDCIKNFCLDNEINYRRIVSEPSKNKLTSGYEQPEKLGVDRWVALIGAQNIFPESNVLVVDAGTATTIDLLDATGKHHGGWILPGISALFTTILTGTANVKPERLTSPSLMFGTNTNDNVNNSCWAATVGLVIQAIKQAETKVGKLDKVILTGGNSTALNQLISEETQLIDHLIFHGLYTYM